jgi:hypothetical protein
METFQLYFTIISCSVFFVFGGFGNIISIVIFNNKEFRKQPLTVYLISACLMNIVTILYLPAMMLVTLWKLTTVTCKLLGILIVLITELQAWITAMGSFDRLITVMMPFKYLFKNKLKFQLSAITSVFAFLSLTIVPFVYYYDEERRNDSLSRCALPQEHAYSWILPYFKIQAILFRYAIPFLIMVISSFLIVLKVCRMKIKLSINSDRQKEVHLAKSLVAIDIFFIIFRLPMLFYVLFYTKNDDRLVFNFTFSIFLAFGTINNVFFFIILIFFNKIFKNMFLQYIKCKNYVEDVSISSSSNNKKNFSAKWTKNYARR